MAQANQKMGDGYKVWEEPEENLPAGVWGLRGSVAARRQGAEPHDRFLLLLLKARHIDRKDLGDKEVLFGIAEEAELDVARFREDLEDPVTLQEVADSHTEAVERHGVFGTPTFVFPSGGSAFVKMLRPETPEDAVKAYDTLTDLIDNELFIGEVKRPQPPWPRGTRRDR